jgi:DHA3 family macrolide efflux protein-like MFS transporter
MQEKISQEYLGRVFGLHGSLMSFALLLGFIVTGVFADIVGVNTWFLISGLVIFLLAVSAFLMPSVRNVE